MKALYKTIKKFFKKKNKQANDILEKLENSYASPFRILFFIDGYAATYSISFELPLKKPLDSKLVTSAYFTQNEMATMNTEDFQLLKQAIKKWRPTHFIFSRYGGNYSQELFHLAIELNIKTIYHIDDDLFSFPESMPDIYKSRHLQPETLSRREFLIKNCHLVYCSTVNLENALSKRFQLKNTTTGIYCPYPGIGSVRMPTQAKTIGYMGTKSHLRDLELTLPLIYAFLQKNPDWSFELFGDFKDLNVPKNIQQQIVFIEPIRGYENFRQSLQTKNWRAAFAPLVKDSFNEVKAVTKFIEYTTMGCVCIATPFGPYRDLILKSVAIDLDQLNLQSLEEYLFDAEKIHYLHQQADSYCKKNFSIFDLENQVMKILSK